MTPIDPLVGPSRLRSDAESIADFQQRIALSLAVLVGIDLQGDGQPGVAEDDLCVAGGDTKVLEQGRGRMPEIRVIRSKERAKFPGSTARPVAVVNTSSWLAPLVPG